MCLYKQIRRVTAAAEAGGALKPLNTSVKVVRDGGVNFVVRTLRNMVEKEKSTKQSKSKGRNPFLPHEPELFVQEVGQTHKVLLNKFPVIAGHMLLCTKDFQRQTDPLNAADFGCLWAVFTLLNQHKHMAFYNFGAHSGRSQPHKHIQIVPLPLDEGDEKKSASNGTPLNAIIREEVKVGQVTQLSCYPFAHGVVRLPELGVSVEPSLELGRLLLEVLKQVLTELGLSYASCVENPSLSYNVLMTKEWLMVVPRSREEFQGFKVNAVGFAGSLLVQNEEMLAKATKQGPIQILSEVALS